MLLRSAHIKWEKWEKLNDDSMIEIFIFLALSPCLIFVYHSILVVKSKKSLKQNLPNNFKFILKCLFRIFFLKKMKVNKITKNIVYKKNYNFFGIKPTKLSP